MSICYDADLGMLRVYRTPVEIREDMDRIRGSIEETNERLNPRSLICNMLHESKYGDPREIVLDLEEAVSCAREALIRLGELQGELASLEVELRETRWAMGLC